MRDRSSKLSTVGIAALLFAANAFVCHKLFFTEYLNQMASIEGAFIAIIRFAMQNRGDMSWWPLWFCGMPLQNVYGPALHQFVALTATLLKMSPALAFHAVAATLYSLGPVTLVWMTLRLTGSRLCGYWAGLLYSVISPVVLLIPVVRDDTGGFFTLRRLHNIVVWGEQPHVASLALAPLALLALDATLRKPRPAYYSLSAIVLACLVLTNVTGAVGFAMILAAYLLSKSRAEWPSSLIRLALIGLLAYALAAPWIPPSTIRLISANSQHSAGNYYPLTPLHVLYFGLIATAAASLWLLFAKFQFPNFLRFALFLCLFSGAIVFPSYWWKVAILPQPERFQLEFEMGCCLAAAFGLAQIHSRALTVVLSLLCLAALIHHRRHADDLIQPIDITRTTEYKEALWFDHNMRGRRVFAPGSVSFWMNIFTDTPQLGGCCDQGVSSFQQLVALYVIYTGQNAGARDAEISRTWLQAYGVHAIGVSGPGGGEWYKPFANPRKFDGVLPELWREGGDVIYQVPQRSDSLAHVVKPWQVASRTPIHGLDIEPLRPFVEALNDLQLPLAPLEWSNHTHARISTTMSPGDLLAVQISYHPGWRALVNGSERRIESDALDLIVIHPECSGACVVDLIYDGGLETKLAMWAHTLSALVCLILPFFGFKRQSHTMV